LWAIGRGTLQQRRIFALPAAQLGECSISADGGWLTAAYAGPVPPSFRFGALSSIRSSIRSNPSGVTQVYVLPV
jgi:hypothetical protein